MMMVLQELVSYKDRFLHAYRTQREAFETFNANDMNVDFYHKMAVNRCIALQKIDSPLEILAMDISWIVQRIRHPIKIGNMLRELSKYK